MAGGDGGHELHALDIYNAFISRCGCDAAPSQVVYYDNLRQGLTRSDVDPHAVPAVLPVAPDNSLRAGKTPLVKEMPANALDGGRLAGSPYPCVRSYLCAGDSGEERIARG